MSARYYTIASSVDDDGNTPHCIVTRRGARYAMSAIKRVMRVQGLVLPVSCFRVRADSWQAVELRRAAGEDCVFGLVIA